MPRHTFKLSVLGRYPARLAGNESAVTANLIAGNDGHLIYCGTITMSEGQFETFTRVLAEGLGDGFELEEPHGSEVRQVSPPVVGDSDAAGD